MDSQWFNQAAATQMNGCDHKNAGNKIDLTLKLGLPNSTAHENQYHANFDTDALSSHESMGMNNFANSGQSFNPNEVAWPPYNLGSQYSHAQQNNGCGFSPFPGSSYYYNTNPSNNLQPPAATAMKDYTLIDVPSSRRVYNRELGFVGSSSAPAPAPARWRASAGNMRRRGFNIDPFKRCTNYNCNTNDTPMWRKGPLGPKTLCNACGIKYRKEEEKRKAKEENKSNADQDSNTQTA